MSQMPLDEFIQHESKKIDLMRLINSWLLLIIHIHSLFIPTSNCDAIFQNFPSIPSILRPKYVTNQYLIAMNIFLSYLLISDSLTPPMTPTPTLIYSIRIDSSYFL